MRINVLGVGFDSLTMAEAVDRAMELVCQPGAPLCGDAEPGDRGDLPGGQRGKGRRQRRGPGAAGTAWGVIKGAAMLGTPLKERTPGVEFAAALMDRLAAEGKSLYLLGARPGVAETAAEKLTAAHPGCGSPVPATAISKRTAR